MHPARSWWLFLILAASAAQAADIYKWTDSDGVVHYSDQPHPGAIKIAGANSNSSISTYSGATAAGAPVRPAQRPNNAPPSAPAQIAVVSPQPEQTFFGDNPVSAAVQVTPALRGTHLITWRLNGAELPNQPTTATQLTLPPLDRGTYSISASLKDQVTGETAESNSVTFYVRQPSALSPQAKHH